MASSNSNVDNLGDAPGNSGKSRRPRYSRFSQQEVTGSEPILTPIWFISTLAVFGVIFVPVGYCAFIASKDVVEISHRYDTECIPQDRQNEAVEYIQSPDNKPCRLTLTVPKRMAHPVYVYYQLDKFYANHRRYVKSRNDRQLKFPNSEKDTSHCLPKIGNPDSPTVPCGLIAWSMFNDTYKFSRNNDTIPVNKLDISWKYDRVQKFGKNVYPQNFPVNGLLGGANLNSTIPLSQQEDLIVWMHSPPMPFFRKMYGKIEKDLMQGEAIQVLVENVYDTYMFSGKKILVLSTTSWLGQQNKNIGICFLVVGGLCLFLVFAFTVIYIFKPRKLGDPTLVSWNKNPKAN